MTLPPPSPDPTVHARIVAAMLESARDEGYTRTALPSVRLLRSNRPLASTPALYEPGIVIVCQGRKRGFWGEREYLYDERHVLAVAVPVPFTMEAEATATEPLLAIYLSLDLAVAAELVVQLDALVGPAPQAPASMVSSVMDPALSATVLRLLEALASPVDSAVLGPALVREIHFRVLCGEQGGAIRAALARRGQFGKIARAVRRIHADFAEPLDVDALAREAGMSVAAFHLHFKSVTDTSPLQYLKTVRLHQARLAMLRTATTAANAGALAGYESASQFSREFKRLFGLSPREEVARLRASFALPPARNPDGWIASH